jgi:putative hydrolase of the HAD superfamily
MRRGSILLPACGDLPRGLCNASAMPASPTHLLLDFFGTVVEYSASRTAQEYARTFELTTRMGSTLGYRGSLDAWSEAFDGFDVESSASGREFSMHQVAQVALTGILDRRPDPQEVEAGVESYMADWSQGIQYLDGMLDVLQELSESYTLAIVSNTHDVDLVPRHLRRMGAIGLFAAVVTSIDIGWCKPHPKIFEAALDALGIGAADAVFVGDTHLTDYIGPQRCGIRAFLIDSGAAGRVPAPRQINSLRELAGRLTTLDLS